MTHTERRPFTEQKGKTPPPFPALFMEWHDKLARVGVEQEINLSSVTAMSLNNALQLTDPPEIFSMSKGLWRTEQMQKARNNIRLVSDIADAFYGDLSYQKRADIALEEGAGFQRDTYNDHGARISYFLFEHMGITDPIVHALARLHDYKNFFSGDIKSANEALEKHLHECVLSGTKHAKSKYKNPETRILPKNIIDLIAKLGKDDERVARAAKRVNGDKQTPIEFKEGREHTPESLWNLFLHTTEHHTTDNIEDHDKYLSPLAIFSADTSADEYRIRLARLALAYDKYMHPKSGKETKDIQAEGLEVLMEMWPLVRGIDESILSRFAGDIIGRAFMPQAWGNLGKVVKEMYPDNTLLEQRQKYAEWFIQMVGKHALTLNYPSPLETLRKEYAMLNGAQEEPRKNPWGAMDVVVPGYTSRVGNALHNASCVDIKTRSSFLWKKVEDLNDPKKRNKLTKGLDSDFGSEKYWRRALEHNHDTFRTQLFFVGANTVAQMVEMAEELKDTALSPGNKAKVSFEPREEELYEEKQGVGLRVNVILNFGAGGNLEIQLLDSNAVLETKAKLGGRHHTAYKLRHQSQVLAYIDREIEQMVGGAIAMRKRHLEMTYMFLDEKDERSQLGNVYTRRLGRMSRPKRRR